MAAVSVIVPCHNAFAFLAGTIESVLEQDFSEWELIAVDDGSQDETWKTIERYEQLDFRVRGFQKQNEGTTRTRNYGAAMASTESKYLFFLDHDDQLERNTLTRLSGYLDQHPTVGLVGCQFREINAAGQKLDTGKRSRWAPGRIFPHEMRDDEIETPFVVFFCATGQGPFAMYRRSIYEQTTGWEKNFWPHEDTDMFCQMALRSEVHFLPDRLYLKRLHPAQGMNDGARVQEAYGKFREKWDNRVPAGLAEANLLQRAKQYYYSTHRPFRDLKVSRQAFAEFIAHRHLSSLRWALRLAFSAVHGAVVYRTRRKCRAGPTD